MGEATNSSRGRATRPPKPSRRRGTTFYDRLEEARLRRQVVLAAKKVAGSSPTVVGPAISRSETGNVESIANSSAVEESDQISTETSARLPDGLERDAVAPEIASSHEPEESFGQSLRIFGPGIVLGFVAAIVVIGWTGSPPGPITPVAVVGTPDPGQNASSALMANLGQNTASGKGPLAKHQISALARIIPAPDDPDLPRTASWLPSIEAMSSPARIVPATVELPPLFNVMPPARRLGPPIVLNTVPPARPETAEPPAIATPVFPGLDIVLHIPNGVRRIDAQTLIAAASEAGFEIDTARPAAFNISRTNIRYFHESDEIAAQALAIAVGGRLRNFTDFRPPPDPGVIEVWLEGRGTALRGREDTAARRGIFRNLRAELRRVFRPAGG